MGQNPGPASPCQRRAPGSVPALPGLGAEPGGDDPVRRWPARQSHRPRVQDRGTAGPPPGRPKRVFTKQQIYEAVWREECAVEDKTIAVHISNIRAKLRPSGTDGYIQTVWGIGFKLAEG